MHMQDKGNEQVWRKAKASGSQGNCVEMARAGDMVEVRNSRHPDGPRLSFTQAEVGALFAGVRGGEFDDLIS
jgi:hypothetical protein